MKFKREINVLRRKITQQLTKNIGKVKLGDRTIETSVVSFQKILICRPNHRLGNLLLITPLVQEINAAFPQCKIDLFVKGGLAPIIFENYNSIDSYINLPKKPFKELLKYVLVWFKINGKKYDLVINIDQNSSSGRLSTQFATADYKFFGEKIDAIAEKYPDHIHLAKYPVYEFRYYLTQLGFGDQEKPVPTINIKLTPMELQQAKQTLDRLVTPTKKTISIFTFATGSKCYSTTWWTTFYEKLKEAFPEYTILEVLPVENVSQIDFKAPSLYSKDIREIAAVIANTELFIGADSGIMHLASSSQTTVIGLFSASKLEKYEPYCNNSVAIDTHTVSIDEIITIAKEKLALKS